jgi:hypothetical protein
MISSLVAKNLRGLCGKSDHGKHTHRNDNGEEQQAAVRKLVHASKQTRNIQLSLSTLLTETLLDNAQLTYFQAFSTKKEYL